MGIDNKDNKDNELLARLHRGDEHAISDLADRYASKIYHLAFRYLRNREDAEEVVQDVLYKVHRKIGDFRGDSALSSWIFRVTFNATMSRLRTARYHHLRDDERHLHQTEEGENRDVSRA